MPLPGPGAARTAAEFVARLRTVKSWSGLSYRALERRARRVGDQLPASTVASALNRVSLPSEEVVAALVRACGGDATAVGEWTRARRAIVAPAPPTGDGYPQTLGPRALVAAHGGSAVGDNVAPPPRRPAEHRGGHRDPPAPREITPYLLPPDLPVFVGRGSEVATASQLLRQGPAGPATMLITGPAGIGKTALAVRVGHLLAPQFPGGQLYTDLRGFGDDPADPGLVLGAFLRALGVRGGAVPVDLASRIHLYRTLLAQREILVVLDNAGGTRQVNDLLPSGGRCAAIVTSRTTLADLTGRRLPLGVLDAAAGLTLLGTMLGRDRMSADEGSARSIVRSCGGLPLAVWVAGARLAARPHWPLVRVARALADEQRKLDELAVGDVAIRASLELTYRTMSPTAQHALRMLSLLPGPDFAVWALAALLDTSLSHAEAVLDDLVEVHLVEVGPVGLGGFRYQLHDLVRLLGRERAGREVASETGRAAFRRLLDAGLQLAVCAADALSADFQGIPQSELTSWRFPPADVAELLGDPLLWFDGEGPFLIAVVDQMLEDGDTIQAAGLAIALTTFFQVRSHFDEWERLQGRALKAALHAGDQRGAALLHRCLGELTTILDRYPQALGHFAHALRLAGDEGPTYQAGAAAGLAYVHRLLGDYPEATRYFTQAADLAESVGNVNCLVYAKHGIGVIALERGDVETARQRFEECLRVSRTAGYRPGEAQALRGIGQSHRALGAYTTAAYCFQQAASISESLGDRLGATHATCWLGDVLVRQGVPGDGRRILARSLWTYREFGNLWGEAAALYALAEAQLRAGRVVPARRRAASAVDLWRRIGARAWLAIGLDTLAEAHTMAGDHPAALGARAEAAALRAALDGGPRADRT